MSEAVDENHVRMPGERFLKHGGIGHAFVAFAYAVAVGERQVGDEKHGLFGAFGINLIEFVGHPLYGFIGIIVVPG